MIPNLGVSGTSRVESIGRPGAAPEGGRGSLTLRWVFLLFATMTVVYVAGFSAIIALRVGPTARRLREDSHTAMAAWVTRTEVDSTLEHALDAVWRVTRESEARRIGQEELAALRASLRRVAGPGFARVPEALGSAAPEVRAALDSAWGQETAAVEEFGRAVRALELGERVVASARLVRADSVRHVANRLLLGIERPAFMSTFRGEREVINQLDATYTFTLAWLAGGGLLILLIAWFAQWRVYRPLAELDQGLRRVAEGDLTAAVPVRYQDELGRVNHHFNRMTGLLRAWADGERRRADNLADRLGRVLEESANEIFVFDAQSLRFQQVNAAARANTGFSSEELSGRGPADLLPDYTPPCLDGVLRDLQEGRERRAVLRTKILRKDGSAYPANISLYCSTTESPPVFIAIAQDVTEQQEVEARQAALQAAVERSAREWTGTFDAIEDPIILASMTGSVIRLNEAARRTVARPHVAVIGQSLSAFAEDELWGRAAELVARVRHTGRSTSSQVHSPRQGRTWAVEARAVTGLANSGDVMLIVAHDITAIVRLQQSLRRSETMAQMGALVAGVAHEVRNPLFGMSATLDAFEARRGRLSVCEPHFSVLREQLERLQHLMTDLLEYGKPPTLELGSLDIHEVMRQAWQASGVAADGHGVRLVSLMADELPRVRGDRLRLVQVFTNLFTNAVQHSPDGASVRVQARHLHLEGRLWLECAVLDQGPGFGVEDLPHVFEPFYTRRRGGTGLGLALVQRIVEQHGGAVEAENLESGGASVRVRLPLAH